MLRVLSVENDAVMFCTLSSVSFDVGFLKSKSGTSSAIMKGAFPILQNSGEKMGFMSDFP